MRAVCGLDVHKDSVFLCILHDSGEIFENVFEVLTHELRKLSKLDAVMQRCNIRLRHKQECQDRIGNNIHSAKLFR